MVTNVRTRIDLRCDEDFRKELEKGAKKNNMDITRYIKFCVRYVHLEKKVIYGDKTLDKPHMINWFIDFFKNHGDIFTLDYLRGQKQNFEAVYNTRK